RKTSVKLTIGCGHDSTQIGNSRSII
ncbi:hypothetical protein D030_3379B, partial [Vibrio parahaemolyticus AQ3810]